LPDPLERVVVCFRRRGAVKRGEAEEPVDRAEALVGRGTALGGRVIAWHVQSFAFDFPPEALEDAIELVAGEDAGSHEGFGIGVAAGELAVVVEGDARLALGRGPALLRAMALSQIARRGEVLLDPALEAVRAEELLCSGSRLGVFGRERVRGLSLDLRFPWRAGVAGGLARLTDPELVGGPAPSGLDALPGAVSVVRARRGAGGSRFLGEVARAHADKKHLFVVPTAAGEPLGALCAALGAVRAEVTLDDEDAASLESLLAGEGLDLEASSELLSACLAGASGALVLIDEPHDIDADTLEVVAHAAQRSGLSIVTRVAASEQLPQALLELEQGPELQLDALGRAPSSEVARSFTGGALDDRTATRWGKRGGGWPLAIFEALGEGIESGELVWQDERLVPRLRIAGRGRTHSARHWIERRLRFVSPAGRALLDALAALGGRAERSTLERLLRLSGAPSANVGATAGALAAARWLSADARGRYALPSATHRVELGALMEPMQKRMLHAAVSRMLSESERPLAVCAAALHAWLAGDSDRALLLGRRAAATAHAVGLSDTADALEHFAVSGARAALSARGLGGVFRVELGEAPSGATDPAPPMRSEPPERRADLLAVMGSDSERAPPSAVAQALREGRVEEVERIARELRQDGEHALLADRLEAMAALGRGQTGEALRLLRAAKDQARQLSAVERCRAALAHGIGLARAGRKTEALLETLEGLARAREAGDVAGERACARFLAQLSRSVGQDAPAAAWDALAQPPS
jgi:hypothetical protein